MEKNNNKISIIFFKKKYKSIANVIVFLIIIFSFFTLSTKITLAQTQAPAPKCSPTNTICPAGWTCPTPVLYEVDCQLDFPSPSCSSSSPNCPNGWTCPDPGSALAQTCIWTGAGGTATPPPTSSNILGGQCSYLDGVFTDCSPGWNCPLPAGVIGTRDCVFVGFPEEPQETKTPDLNPLGQLQIKIPGIDELAEKYPIICEDENNKESCKIPWIAIYIYAAYNYLLGVGGVLAAIALMIGGVTWLISAGNATRVSQAKNWIVGSITGVVILITSYVLLYEINPDLVGTKYIVLQTIESNEQTEPFAPSVFGLSVGADGVPYFAQTDPAWGSKCYPNQSIHHSGCGVTSLAMITKYFSDSSNITPPKEIRPDSVATCICEGKCVQTTISQDNIYPSGLKSSTNTCGSSISLTGQISKINKCFNLNLKINSQSLSINYQSIRESLKAGNKVVMNVKGIKSTGKDCILTNEGHYVVITGVNTDNSFNINDPYPTQRKLKADPSGITNIAGGTRPILAVTEGYLRDNCSPSFWMAIGSE